MTYTYDIGTAVGQLRFLVQDHDMSSIAPETPLEQRSAAFSDEELAFVLTQQPDLLSAAAMTLRVWASNKQLIVQLRRNGKTELDYGDIRRDLLAAADAYEAQANSTAADATAEVNWNAFSERRILWNEMLREGTA